MARISGLFTVSLIALLSLPTPATADDYDWTGFFIGANSGAAWGEGDTDVTVPFDGAGYFAFSSTQSINTIGKRRLHDVGFTGGAQAGFDWQTGPLVLGLETDFQRFDLTDSDHVTEIYPCCAPDGYQIQNDLETDWLYTLRGKVGVALGRVLVFGSGGLAVTDLEENFDFRDNNTAARESGTIHTTKAGWAAGAGVEVGILANVSVRAEYLHVGFGKESKREDDFITALGPFPATNMKHQIDLDAEIARLAVNLRF